MVMYTITALSAGFAWRRLLRGCGPEPMLNGLTLEMSATVEKQAISQCRASRLRPDRQTLRWCGLRLSLSMITERGPQIFTE